MKNYSSEELSKIELEIEKGIELCNSTASWSQGSLKGEIRQDSLRSIKDTRRAFKKIKNAIQFRPSAAMYGESQVGKSYLIKSLLSKPQEPFNVKDDSTGKKYDFLEEINPAGGGTEATSLVTRFSTRVEIPQSDFPVKIHLLEPKDILLVLCDTYYQDVVHDSLPKHDEINLHIERCRETLNLGDDIQNNLTEDDIFDVKEYFLEHFKSVNSDIPSSDNLWNYLADTIAYLPPNKWVDILDILWAKNKFISNTFNLFVNGLEGINFAKVVYTEYTTVLREYGTLLDVARLKELGGSVVLAGATEQNYIKDANITYEQNGNWQQKAIEKKILCALTAELVLKVDKSLEETKPFLRDNDLLDFPGARSRENNNEAILSEAHVGQMVLRGKVSYIFNKYSSQYLINNLLFCNKDIKIEVTYIPRLLNSWIENYIGKTPEERSMFLEGSKYPPLFMIYTFFNMDLKFNPINDKVDSLDNKWVKRFHTIFKTEILTKNYDWHHNWTEISPNFQNNYLLRDFNYSDDTFTGYAQSKAETGIKPNEAFPDYMERLEQSFLEFDFVKSHFYSPKEAWDAAATLNNDGSDLILRNLNIVSGNGPRTRKFIRECSQGLKALINEMHRHYHDDESDDKIKQASRAAGEIQLNMDDVFGKNPYAFSQFMESLVLNESEVYNFFKELLASLETVESMDVDNYVLIRNSNPGLSPNNTYEENMAVLMETYGHTEISDMEESLAKKGIDPIILFNGEAKLIKNNSELLADALRDHWFDNVLQVDNFKSITDMGFGTAALEDLLTNIKSTYQEVKIDQLIASSIREYVDRFDSIEEAEEMISDISVATINNFINSMGYEYWSEEKLESIRETVKENGLNIRVDLTDHYLEYSNDKLAQVFDNMYSYEESINKVSIDPNIVKEIPNIYNIGKWRDQMKLSFIANCDIPTYDIEANQNLGSLIEQTKEVHF